MFKFIISYIKYPRNDILSFEDLQSIVNYTKKITLQYEDDSITFFYDRDDSRLFYPNEGTLHKTKIQLMPYDIEQFYELCNDRIFSIECEEYLPNKISQLFDEVNSQKYYDYEYIVQELYEKNIVNIEKSTNVMAASPFKFQIKNQEFYEVDCLGSKLHRDLTKNILDLYYNAMRN